MEWERCFARDVNVYDAPFTYGYADDENFSVDIDFYVFGFYGTYNYKIYRGNTLVASGTGFGSYDSVYEDYYDWNWDPVNTYSNYGNYNGRHQEAPRYDWRWSC